MAPVSVGNVYAVERKRYILDRLRTTREDGHDLRHISYMGVAVARNSTGEGRGSMTGSSSV